MCTYYQKNSEPTRRYAVSRGRNHAEVVTYMRGLICDAQELLPRVVPDPDNADVGVTLGGDNRALARLKPIVALGSLQEGI